jgi:transcriptional regulator with PAS, ATPase and Fis domain
MSATCEDIHSMIELGTFRKDLYARISTFQISLSPLRERREDIELLFHYFISKQPFRILINDLALECLHNYSWPQNTREIQDLVENWVVHGHRLITPDVLPSRIKNNIFESKGLVTDEHLDLVEEMGLKEFLVVFKKELIQGMTKRHNGTVRTASKAMDVSPAHVSRYLQTHKDKSFKIGRLQ